MTFPVLDIPADAAELAAWLEQHLVGPDLGDLVRGLEVIHGTADNRDVDEILDRLPAEQLDEIIRSGLRGRPVATLRLLMTNPRTLFALQDRILDASADYWFTLADRQADPDHTDRIIAGIHHRLQEDIVVSPGEVIDERIAATPQRAWPRKRIVAVVAALVAVVTVAIGLSLRNPSPPAWGLAALGSDAGELTGSRLNNRLADLAQAWFKKRPDTPHALALRLEQFSAGCRQLSDQPFTQVSDEQRTLIHDACRTCQLSIDETRAALLAGRVDVSTAQSSADAAVNAFIDTLRHGESV